ncbi:MAG TPA: response regulator, partial [Actinomycetota bacterium]|nr:response regulator [Actinomycetota bacterium]
MSTEPVTVLVGGRDQLERELVRFFMEEAGFRVLSMVSQDVDLVRQVEVDRPDAVIVFSSLTDADGTDLVHRIRRASRRPKIVVVTPSPETAWKGPARGADAFVEQWIGIQQLGSLLSRLCRRGPSEEPVSEEPAEAPGELARAGSGGGGGRALPPPPPPDGGGRWDRWFARLQGAAVASVVFLALFVGGTIFNQSPPTPQRMPPAVAAHLNRAYVLLDHLIDGMRDNIPSRIIVRYARQLSDERNSVAQAGDYTSALDQRIEQQVSPYLDDVPPAVAQQVMTALGDLVAPPSPSPSPDPGVIALPTTSPSPTPDLSPSPTTAPSPTDAPSPTTAPSPST